MATAKEKKEEVKAPAMQLGLIIVIFSVQALLFYICHYGEGYWT